MSDSGALQSDLDSNGLLGLSDLETTLYTHREEEEEEEEKAGTNVALIVGVVVGSGVLVAMIVIGCLYCVRKRAKISEFSSVGNSGEKGNFEYV